MRRDPTIHVKQSALVSVLVDIKYDKRMTPQELAEKIMIGAQPYQLRNRYLIEGKAKTVKRAQKTMDATNPIVEKFNRMLMEERLKAGHKGIKLISKESKDYLLLKEISKIAYDFCEEMEVVPRDDGYREFIRAGMRMMNKKYAVNKFKYYADRIIQHFQDMVTVVQDDDPTNTDIVCEIYRERVELDFPRTDYGKYVNFVYARRDADAQDAYYEDWVEAQFDGLAFMMAVPELSQLHGDKALERYQRFMAKPELKAGEVVKMSEAERAYRDKLRLNK